MKVSSESKRGVAIKRRRLIAGALVFSVEQGQLRSAFANPSVKNREEQLDAQVASDTSVRATRLRSALDLRQRDASVLLQGDSTGNEKWEFFYLIVRKLCTAYPTHTVSYSSWNPDAKVWVNTVLQTGTTGKVLRLYNGSIPGSSPIYWQGANKSQAYDGLKFDLILVNYGLNTASTDQIASACACLYNLRYDQPQAELVMILQPPDYTDAAMLDRSQARSDALRRVSAAYGVAVADVFSLFSKLVNRTGNVAAWYKDKIHPNAAGQKRWADFLFPFFLHTASKQRPFTAAATRLPNGNFTRWPNGNSAAPLWWKSTAGVMGDTTYFESQSQAVRSLGSGSGTGIFSIGATEVMQQLTHLPQIVIAARVRSSGSSNKPGTLYLAHSVSTAFTDIRGNDNGYLGVGSGAFRWAFLVVPRDFYTGKTDFQIGIFSGEAGEQVTVDRIVLSSDLMPPDSDGTEGFVYEASYNDAAFKIPAKAIATRLIVRPFAVPGADIQVRCPSLPSFVMVSASAGVEATGIRFANHNTSAVNMPAQAYTLRIS